MNFRKAGTTGEGIGTYRGDTAANGKRVQSRCLIRVINGSDSIANNDRVKVSFGNVSNLECVAVITQVFDGICSIERTIAKPADSSDNKGVQTGAILESVCTYEVHRVGKIDGAQFAASIESISANFFERFGEFNRR